MALSKNGVTDAGPYEQLAEEHRQAKRGQGRRDLTVIRAEIRTLFFTANPGASEDEFRHFLKGLLT